MSGEAVVPSNYTPQFASPMSGYHDQSGNVRNHAHNSATESIRAPDYVNWRMSQSDEAISPSPCPQYSQPRHQGTFDPSLGQDQFQLEPGSSIQSSLSYGVPFQQQDYSSTFESIPNFDASLTPASLGQDVGSYTDAMEKYHQPQKRLLSYMSPDDFMTLQRKRQKNDGDLDDPLDDKQVSFCSSWLDMFQDTFPGLPEHSHCAALGFLIGATTKSVEQWLKKRLINPSQVNSPIQTTNFVVQNPKAQKTLKSSKSKADQSSAISKAITLASRVNLIGSNDSGEPKCHPTDDPEDYAWDEEKAWQCTGGCGKKFSCKKDWKRHEEVNHPQKRYVCLIGFLKSDGSCGFCSNLHPDAAHILSHQQKNHRFLSSHPTHTPCGSMLQRKDHLGTHLKQMHASVPSAITKNTSTWCLLLNNLPHSCGFCSEIFTSWNGKGGRINHISDHFENEKKTMAEWKGLRVAIVDRSASRAQNSGAQDRLRSGSHFSVDSYDSERSSVSQCNNAGRSKASRVQSSVTSIDGSTTGNSRHCSPRMIGAQIVTVEEELRTPRHGFGDVADYPQFHTPESQLLKPRPDNNAALKSTEVCPLTEAPPVMLQSVQPTSNGVMFEAEVANCKKPRTRSLTKGNDPFLNAFFPAFNNLDELDRLMPHAIEVIRPLGHGAFSKVEEVFHLATNVRLARKTVSVARGSVYRYLALEAKVLQQLRHAHIIRLVDSLCQKDTFSIFLSPVAETNLAEYLETSIVGAPESKVVLRGFFQCLTSALRHLHESSFTHGDIKPTNILITKERVPKVLLCDFGASRSKSDFDIAPGEARPFTWRYCAPEAIHPSRRGRRADIFSLGCVFLEIAATLWLTTQNELRRFRLIFKKAANYHTEIPQALFWLLQMKRQMHGKEERIFSVISNMISANPEDRPSVSDLSLIFPPRTCCEIWPSSSVVSVTSFEAFHTLATVQCRSAMLLWSQLEAEKESRVSLHNPSKPSTLSELDFGNTLLDYSLRQDPRREHSSNELILMRQWLLSCEASHMTCTSIKQQAWFPSRLVDVGMKGKHRHEARLILTAEEPLENENYVALSDLWGDTAKRYLELTRSSLSALKKSIAIKKLTPLVANAFEITRRIGKRYLWVDSLCIIQDSLNDLDCEARDLPSIYRNAHVTIAATNAYSTAFGLRSNTRLKRESVTRAFPDSECRRSMSFGTLRREKDSCVPPNSKNVESWSKDDHICVTNTENIALHSRVCAVHEALTLENEWVEEIMDATFQQDEERVRLIIAAILNRLSCDQSEVEDVSYKHWNRRGPVFQGHLLTRRVIYLSENQVHWECRSLRASDTFPHGLSPLLWESIQLRSQNLFSFKGNSGYLESPYTQRQIEHYNIWSDIVSAYSRRCLLHDRNRLVPLRGLSEEMQKVVGDDYLSGHWKRTLSWSLLWRSSGSEELVCQKGDPYLPSWSWAGWNMPIKVPKYFAGKSLIEVTTPDGTSQVRTLRLRGRLSVVCLSRNTNNPTQDLHVPINGQKDRSAMAHFDVTLDTSDLHVSLYALWIRSSTSSPLANQQFSMSALLLDHDSKTNTFLRCGICTIVSNKAEGSSNFEWSENDVQYVSKEAQLISIR